MSTLSDTKEGLSRAEAETLCLLHALEPAPLPAAGLCARLGLERSFATSVVGALAPLSVQGWVCEADGDYSLTDAGIAHLRGRLQALGVALRVDRRALGAAAF